MWEELRRSVLFAAVTMALFGGGYQAVLWGVARLAFPSRAEGSLIRRPDGSVAGSRLIAQAFTRPEYFRPRPSAADYDAASSGGSNAGPSNPEYRAVVRRRLLELTRRDDVDEAAVPAEMITASGSGLDPHIPPSGAVVQARRVAQARGLACRQVLDLVAAHVESPLLGLFGRPRVNVLELNLALDAAFGPPASSR